MELLKALKPYLQTRYEVVADRADLSAYFFERGLRVLKRGGRLGYISSSTFFKTGSGKPLRNYLRREAQIENVVNFGDIQIFEGVTTYPAILTMKRGTAPADQTIHFWNVDAIPDGDFSAAFQSLRKDFPQIELTDGSWEFESTELLRLRQKIRAGKRTLKEVYGPPCRGIVTGLNAAFVIDMPTRDRLVQEDPRSADLLRPWLEGKDLKRWRAEPRGLWIIYIPKNRIDIDDYPAIKAHLNPFRERLEARATKQEWFELQQAQEAYSRPISRSKLSYPHFNSQRLFSFEPTGAFSNDKTYFIPTDDLFLLGLLNSTTLWFIITNLSPAVRGGFHELRVQYVEAL